MGNRVAVTRVMDVSAFPDEVWVHIFLFLSDKCVGQIISRVSRKWNQIARTEAVWKAKCRIAHGTTLLEADEDLNWRQRYIEMLFMRGKGNYKLQVLTMSPRPQPRSCHTMSAINDRTLVVIGGSGSDAVHTFDTLQRRFNRVALTGSEPLVQLCNHSAASYNNNVYVFGGIVERGQKTNNVFELNIDERRWTRILTQGSQPRSRSDHATCILGNKMYIFGGSSQSVTALNDLHVLDMSTFTWEPVKLSTHSILPQPRSGHSIVAVEPNLIVLYGGGIWDGEHRQWVRKFNDVHLFNTDTLEWQLLETNGVRPTASKFASVFAIGKHLYVLGGESIDGTEVTPDIHVLDLVTLTWKRLPFKLQLAVDSAAVCICNNTAYMFGGYCSGDKDLFTSLEMCWKTKADKYAKLAMHSRSFHSESDLWLKC